MQHLLASPSVRAGLRLAALFGWLLALPMFGPLLFAAVGAAAPTAGLIFVFTHGAGLLLLHRLPSHPWLACGAGVAAAALSLALPFVAPPVAYGLMAVLGPAAALLVLAWVDGWLEGADRLGALAIAMAGANLVVALVSLPLGPAPGLWLSLTAMLLVGGAFGVGGAAPAAAPLPSPAPVPAAVRPLLRSAVIAIAAFAVADYFVGGIWYNILAASVGAVRPWQPCLEALAYAAAIVVFYWAVGRRQGGQLALYSLSALGLGLVVAASGPALAGMVFAFRAILLVGLAAGDLFFWNELGRLGRIVGGRRAMGLGLGASLLLIGLANLGAGLVTAEQGGPGRPFPLVGAALIFLVIPVVFRFAVGDMAAGGAAAPGQAAPPMLPHLQAELTQAERHVYALLVAGATDQEIAARLYISTHTVKFHVRNILHKAGVANRKELLSRLVAEGNAQSSPRG